MQHGRKDDRPLKSFVRNQFSGENNFLREPVVLQSFLNIFNVRQVTIGTNENDILFFNVPVKAEVDPDVPQKVTSVLST